jgi:hypothetical protein
MKPAECPRRVLTRVVATVLALTAIAAGARLAGAQAIPASGRFSLYTGWSQREAADGSTSDLTEMIANLSLEPPSGWDSIFEYAVDARFATYPSTDRDQTVSIYEAYVGVHSRDGRWLARLGQMWVRELGGLGAVGGLHGEYRMAEPTSIGSLRFGLFAGLEPEYYDGGFADEVRKGGVYVAVDGERGRRHVLGWVAVRNSDLTERSVVVFNNYVPVARSFNMYQALEYDTQGPGDLGDSELSYFFINLRYTPIKVLDLQGTYHRGRSIDTRTITQDQLDGRPVSPDALEGLLFESGRLRVTVRATRFLSLWASYGQDRNDWDDNAKDRFQLGVSARQLFDTGFDVTVSSSQYDDGEDSYDTLYASIGTSVGSRVYITLDYYDSFAVYHYEDGSGGTIEVRPDSSRYALSCNLNLNRTLSFLIVGETATSDDFDEKRVLAGIVVRF